MSLFSAVGEKIVEEVEDAQNTLYARAVNLQVATRGEGNLHEFSSHRLVYSIPLQVPGLGPACPGIKPLIPLEKGQS